MMSYGLFPAWKKRHENSYAGAIDSMRVSVPKFDWNGSLEL